MYNTGGKHEAWSKNAFGALAKNAGPFSVLRRFCAAVVRGRSAPGPAQAAAVGLPLHDRLPRHARAQC